MNNKGLATGLIAIISILFMMSLANILSITLWSQFTTAIDGVDDTIISPQVKDQIAGLTNKILWADKIFVLTFVVLLISYLISSATLPAESPIFMLIFIGILILLTIVAMGLSNSWAWLIDQDVFLDAVTNLSFTSHFLRFLPIITLFIGSSGAIIFFSRVKKDGVNNEFE